LKFRAWDIERKNMSYNIDYIEFNNGQISANLNDSHYSNFIYLMQWTGLKDRNGKDIYEGDIVQIQHSCWTENSQVIFIEGSFVCEQLKKHPKNNGKATPSFIDIIRSKWELEIIGNIYENSELLEVSK